MFESWSFGRKIGAGSAVTVLLTVIMGAFAVFTLQDVVRSKDVVIEVHQKGLIQALRLDALVESHASTHRAFLLTQDDKYVVERDEIEAQVERAIWSLRANESAGNDLVDAIDVAMTAYRNVSREQQAVLRGDRSLQNTELAIVRAKPARQALADAVGRLIDAQEQAVEHENRRASILVGTAFALVTGLGVICSVLAVATAVTLTRVLSRQVNAVVHQMRSSSAELQAAAGQQASGLREQASAMTEVNTTINELQATSRQIAERAKRVAQLAGETAGGARQGSNAVDNSKAAIDSISKQVEQIVTHTLELDRKSQQIGAVLDLVSELSEQTNILAINATIEATGANEGGRRFLVVADEIRKLADRVGGSTKEVRALIEDVRAALSTTVVATETGAKAVESGARQFDELTRVFREIVDLVALVTDAAREIELSTKQQASAVEQVNIAVASVTQATREGEASSSQTLQTAAELASLTRNLDRIVQVGA